MLRRGVGIVGGIVAGIVPQDDGLSLVGGNAAAFLNDSRAIGIANAITFAIVMRKEGIECRSLGGVIVVVISFGGLRIAQGGFFVAQGGFFVTQRGYLKQLGSVHERLQVCRIDRSLSSANKQMLLQAARKHDFLRKTKI